MRTLFTLITLLITVFSYAQSSNAAAEGPFNQMIIRGAILINGNGAPPIGPVDITIENDKITGIEKMIEWVDSNN